MNTNAKAKIDPEIEFHHELTVFGREVDECIQCFYISRTVHEAAAKDKKLFGVLNQHAAFWNATLHALEGNALIVLGRIFDNDKRSHGLERLLNLAEAHSDNLFSKTALENRKRKQSSTVDQWISDYMKTVFVPARRDFRRLRKYVDARRTIYTAKYAPLRNKVIAHKDRVNTSGLFANTNIRELQKIFVFLAAVHHALLNLLQNGYKPRIRAARYSTRRMLDPKLTLRGGLEQEWITRETLKFLESLIRDLPKRNGLA